jgi:hypothetical protein
MGQLRQGCLSCEKSSYAKIRCSAIPDTVPKSECLRGGISYLQGILDRYFKPKSNPSSSIQPISADFLVTSSVPAGAGLSSSAALVVASTLAFLAINDKVGDNLFLCWLNGTTPPLTCPVESKTGRRARSPNKGGIGADGNGERKACRSVCICGHEFALRRLITDVRCQ